MGRIRKSHGTLRYNRRKHGGGRGAHACAPPSPLRPPWISTNNSRLGLHGRCWQEPSRPKGGGVKAQCAPLLLFLRAVAVEGSSIPFATADLEVVAPDKALEAQRMEILQRDLLARFNTRAPVGPSPGDAMTLSLTAFEARTDMLERTRVVCDAAPKAVSVKTLEERWGAVLEGALRIHGCVDASDLPPVYATLAATPKGGERIALQNFLSDPRERKRRGDDHSACLSPLHQRLFHGVPTPRRKFEQLGERDLPASSLGDVYDADTGALRRAAGL